MTPDDDPIITIDDIRRYHCPGGIRRWFEANGLDFRQFLDDGGWPASRLLATGDALAERVVRLTIEVRRDG